MIRFKTIAIAFLLPLGCIAQFEIPKPVYSNPSATYSPKNVCVSEKKGNIITDSYYDATGLLTKSIERYYHSNDSTFLKRTIISFFDSRGNPTVEKQFDHWSDSIITHRKFDEKNRLVEEVAVSIDSAGVNVDTMAFERNEYQLRGSQTLAVIHWRFEFDHAEYFYSNDLYKEDHEYWIGNNTWQIYDSTVYVLNDHNHLEERIGATIYQHLSDEDGRLTASESWYFDEPHNIYGFSYTYKDGSCVLEEVYEENQEGRVILGHIEHTYSENGLLLKSEGEENDTEYLLEYTYDDQGRLIKVSDFGTYEFKTISYRSL